MPTRDDGGHTWDAQQLVRLQNLISGRHLQDFGKLVVSCGFQHFGDLTST